MLVLSRKKNESIVINNDITIVVVEIRGDKVRLGVEAPKEVPVHRREVYEAIHRAGNNGPLGSSQVGSGQVGSDAKKGEPVKKWPASDEGATPGTSTAS